MVDYSSSCNLNSPQNFTWPLSKLGREFTLAIAEFTSLEILDTTFFAC